MRYIFILMLAFFAACTSSQTMGLHEMHRDEAPYWDLVSLTGFDQAMRDAYDTNVYKHYSYGSVSVEHGNVDFDEFKKVSGFAQVYKLGDEIGVAFQACNGISARYKVEDGEWVHKGIGATMRACERTAFGPSGKAVVLATPMFADDWFKNMVPAIKGYRVSEDNLTLILVDAAGEDLAVFKYRGDLIQ